MTTDLRQVWLRLAAVAVLALPGCAYLQGQVAADSEEILAQAGFQRQPLDQPGLPSRQLVEAAGIYKFADPDFCQCMYVGGASEYAVLQRLRAERVADRDWILRHASLGSTYDNNFWAAWKPEGLDVIRAPVAGK
jgi:hypothetical protein